MLESGLLQEAEKFFDSSLGTTARQAIGYKELYPYFSGKKSLEECVDCLKMQTRRYAKRQLTWFRRDERMNLLYIDEYENSGALLDAAMKIIERGSGK